MTPVLIMSACRSLLDAATNAACTERMTSDLERLGLSAKPVFGVYRGASEQSFVVAVPDDDALGRAIALAVLNDQESVLYVGADRRATLLYLASGLRVDLGEFRAVRDDVARASDAYTYDPYTETYFMAG